MKIKPLLIATMISATAFSMSVTADGITLESFADGDNLKIEAQFPEINTTSTTSGKAFKIPVTIKISEDIPANATLRYSNVKLKMFVASDEELVANDWIFKIILNQNDEAPNIGEWGDALLASRFDFNRILEAGGQLNVNAWIRKREAGNAQQVKAFISFFPSVSYIKTETIVDNDGNGTAAAGTDPNRFTVLTTDVPPAPPFK